MLNIAPFLTSYLAITVATASLIPTRDAVFAPHIAARQDLTGGETINSKNFAATAWNVESDKHEYSAGARFYYVDNGPNPSCNGIQELTSANKGRPDSKNGAQKWYKTYCFNTEDYKINKKAAFAVTSLAGVFDNETNDQDLLDLHLFYWTKNEKKRNVIKDAAWNPRSGSVNWTQPSVGINQVVHGADTSKLAAISWIDPTSDQNNWSVFYIESGFLKEITYDGQKSGRHSFQARLDPSQIGNVKDISTIQAMVWVDENNSIQKRVYLLNKVKKEIYEFGVSFETGEKPSGIQWRGKVVSEFGATAMATNTDGGSSGFRLYARMNNENVAEFWPADEALVYSPKNEVYMTNIPLAYATIGTGGKIGGKIATAFQSAGQEGGDDKTWQFVFYNDEKNVLKQSHRDNTGSWVIDQVIQL